MNPQEPIDHRTPVDYLEPEETENIYREVSIRFLRIMSLAFSYILKTKCPRALGVCYGLGLTSVLGTKSMREMGKELNISSGTISYHALKFCELANLPPSNLMKNEQF